jgi:HAD superfamily hydrolase (TIGR01484 family)
MRLPSRTKTPTNSNIRMLDLDSVATITDPDAPFAAFARDCRGIFSDVDDTLTTHGRLFPAAYEALVRAHDAGLRVVLVTGRPLGWAEVMTSLFPIDAAIAENGAVAALPGGVRLYFEDEAARRNGRERREAARARVAQELPHVKPASDQPLRDVDLAFDINETVVLPTTDIDRLGEVLRSCGLATTRSSIHMHGSFSQGDKATMAARVAQHLWAEGSAELAQRYGFIGDSPNDAPAFRFFRHTFGVHNVRQHEEALLRVNALPWAVTRARSGAGFAEVVDRLLEAKNR